MTPANNTITPEVAEKKVSEAVENIVEDEDFLVEEDGDFFWVIQRIAWGTIKTLLAVAIIGVFVWIIWGVNLPFGNNNSEADPFTQDSLQTTERENRIPITRPNNYSEIPDTIDSDIVNDLNIENFAYDLADERIVTVSYTHLTLPTKA